MNIIDIQLNFLDTTFGFKREVSCFASPVNGVISITTDDSAGSVEFDFFEIWETLKGNNPRADQAYMIHSHPPGINRMSSTDENMVYGWRLALGIPIYYFVVTEDGIAKYICDRKENGNPGIKSEGFFAYGDLNISSALHVLATVVYGLSVAEKIEPNDLINIRKELATSRLRYLK